MTETKTQSVFSENYDTELGKGVAIVQVRDKRLAACLIAVGIRLRKDPPYVQVRLANGEYNTTFNFLPADDAGVLKTLDMIKAWGQDLSFIAANPMHPFTFAMCAIRNYQDVLDHLRNDTPYVAFRTKVDGKRATILVKENSRKHKAATDRGLRRM